MSSTINYAKAVGIESLAGAIIFTILYIPIFLWFIRQSFVNPTHVHYTLTFFCTLRVVAFAIRAVLAASVSAAENLNLVIADEALFAIGYFSLIYSAYNLVLDRILLSDPTPPNNPILRITQNRRLFRLAILLGLILGIVSSSTSSSNGSTSSESLHIASTVIFLVVTILQAIQTIYLASKHIVSGQNQYYQKGKNSLGVRYGNYVLLIISLLLVVREAFATATVKNSAKENNEHWWYPFLAIPEILAVVLFATPGLVPRQDEVPEPEYTLTNTAPQYASTPYATTPYGTTPYAAPPGAPYAGAHYAGTPQYAGNAHYTA